MQTRNRLHPAALIERLGFGLLGLVTLAAVLPVVAIVLYIIYKGAPAISWEFLSAMPRDGMRQGGILPAIIGTFYLTLGTALFSVPLGIAAAIYISEYAKDTTLTRVIRIAIINLAGIPSVVYGLFGLGLFVVFLKFGTSILAASLTLSIMTLPVIISTAEEAMRSVPQSFRVVSVSLGATRWETTWMVVRHAGLTGILAAVVLAFSRAFGETLAVMMVVGNTVHIPGSLFDAAYPLPALIANAYSEMMSIPQYQSALMLAALVLMAIVLFFNVAARLVIVRLGRKG